MMTSSPPSPTSDLKCTFEELQLSTSRSRKHHQYEEHEVVHDAPLFHFFAFLPTELRLKIYTLALPSLRIIPIQYASSTTTRASLSRTPSPSPSPHRFPTHKRICGPSNSKTEKHKEYTGCTSPALIPALLHTCCESRFLAKEHYVLSFRLSGPHELFLPKIWFSKPSTSNSISQAKMVRRGEREQDILYFPSLPGYCASFKHYTSILSLLPSSTLSSISRLAVHEDLFLEENKRRASLDSGIGMGWDTTNVSGSGSAVVGNGVVGAYWNTDEIIEERLFDFWRSVARKFAGVEEVWVVGKGVEGDILGFGDRGWEDGVGVRWDGESGMVGGGGGNGVGKDREKLTEMVRRVVGCVEEEMGGRWTVPRWKVLAGGR